MIKKIKYTDFKGSTATHTLYPRTLIMGSNGSGKSTIVEAIYLAMQGAHPRLPATAIRSLMSGDEMQIKAVTEAYAVARTWPKTGQPTECVTGSPEAYAADRHGMERLSRWESATGPARQRILADTEAGRRCMEPLNQLCPQLPGVPADEAAKKHLEALAQNLSNANAVRNARAGYLRSASAVRSGEVLAVTEEEQQAAASAATAARAALEEAQAAWMAAADHTNDTARRRQAPALPPDIAQQRELIRNEYQRVSAELPAGIEHVLKAQSASAGAEHCPCCGAADWTPVAWEDMLSALEGIRQREMKLASGVMIPATEEEVTEAAAAEQVLEAKRQEARDASAQADAAWKDLNARTREIQRRAGHAQDMTKAEAEIAEVEKEIVILKAQAKALKTALEACVESLWNSIAGLASQFIGTFLPDRTVVFKNGQIGLFHRQFTPLEACAGSERVAVDLAVQCALSPRLVVLEEAGRLTTQTLNALLKIANGLPIEQLIVVIPHDCGLTVSPLTVLPMAQS